MGLDGKVVLVTGASSGLGEATAKMVERPREHERCKPSPIGHAPYAASKHAVIGLTKSAAIDYGTQGLRCNVVAPGFTRSEMIDPTSEAGLAFVKQVVPRHSAMNRLGTSDESAAMIAWLCSDAASFVNGAVMSVDGGDSSRMY
jgi:A-factor type gamma-butyrolactone 1'-reductase (1S-forming)